MSVYRVLLNALTPDPYGEKTNLYFDQFKNGAKQFKWEKHDVLSFKNRKEIEPVLKDIADHPHRPIGMIVEHVNPHLIAVLILRSPFERSYVKFFSDKQLLAVVAISKDQNGLSAMFRMSKLDPEFEYLVNKLSTEILLKRRIYSRFDTTKPPREFQVMYTKDHNLRVYQVPQGHIKFPNVGVAYIKIK